MAATVLDARTCAGAVPRAGSRRPPAPAGPSQPSALPGLGLGAVRRWLGSVECSPPPVLEEGSWSGTARGSRSGSGAMNAASANAHRERDPVEEPAPATWVLNSGPKGAPKGNLKGPSVMLCPTRESGEPLSCGLQAAAA